MSENPPENSPRCPETHAGQPPGALGRSAPPARPAGNWYVVAFPDAAAPYRVGTAEAHAEAGQLLLPEPTEWFDPRQRHFDFPAAAGEGGEA